jgi:spore maturation protein CgeB
VLRGPYEHPPRVWSWARFCLWVISFDDLKPAELKRASHLFVASPKLLADFSARGLPVSELLQCTDPEIFSPNRAIAELESEVLFVGSWRRDFTRPIVHQSIAMGYLPKIWGLFWEGRVEASLIAGGFIPNEELGSHYASAKVVLNDHMPIMLKSGFVSNRAFDVLASGAELVTDQPPILGVPLPSVHAASNVEDVGAGIAEAFRGQDERRAVRREIAEYIREHHSFAARARQILAALGKPSGR